LSRSLLVRARRCTFLLAASIAAAPSASKTGRFTLVYESW